MLLVLTVSSQLSRFALRKKLFLCPSIQEAEAHKVATRRAESWHSRLSLSFVSHLEEGVSYVSPSTRRLKFHAQVYIRTSFFVDSDISVAVPFRVSDPERLIYGNRFLNLEKFLCLGTCRRLSNLAVVVLRV